MSLKNVTPPFSISRQVIHDQKRMPLPIHRVIVYDHRSGKRQIHTVTESISSRSALHHAKKGVGCSAEEIALIKASKMTKLEPAYVDQNYAHD